MGRNDAVIAQGGTYSEFDLRALLDETVSIANEFSQFADVFGCEPNAGDISDACEVGEDFGIGGIGLIDGLFHSCDVSRMGEFDVPVGIVVMEFVGEFCGSGAGFDGGGDVVAEGGDDAEDGFGIVRNGLIGKDFALLVHDADLDGLGVVVNADEKW